MSQEAKLLFFHVNGASPQKYIVETVGSGAGFLDSDNDGWMDVYFVNGGPTPATVPAVSAANQLFRNNRDGTFTEVTEKAGVGDTSYGVGCAFADYDNGGFVDICVTNLGSNVMYHNNGDGTFEDISLVSGTAFGESGAPRAGMGVDAADLNGNGLFNIFVTNYSLILYRSPGPPEKSSVLLQSRNWVRSSIFRKSRKLCTTEQAQERLEEGGLRTRSNCHRAVR